MQGDDSCVLTKTTVCLFWRKWRVVCLDENTFMCVWAFSLLCWSGVFFSFERRVATASKKNREYSAFSAATPILFFFFSCLPSFHCFRIKEYRSIENSRSLEVCVYRTQGILWFFPIMCVSVFSRLLVCVTLILRYQASSVSFSISFLSFFLMQFELTFLQVNETE